MKLYEYSMVLLLVPVLQLIETSGSEDSDFCHKDDDDCKKYSQENNHPKKGGFSTATTNSFC
jgi:hypothetical protein